MTNHSVESGFGVTVQLQDCCKEGLYSCHFPVPAGRSHTWRSKKPAIGTMSISGPGLRLKKLVYFLFLFAAVNGRLQAVFLRCRSVAAFEQTVEIAFVAEADLFHNLCNGQLLLLQVLFGIGQAG